MKRKIKLIIERKEIEKLMSYAIDKTDVPIKIEVEIEVENTIKK